MAHDALVVKRYVERVRATMCEEVSVRNALLLGLSDGCDAKDDVIGCILPRLNRVRRKDDGPHGARRDTIAPTPSELLAVADVAWRLAPRETAETAQLPDMLGAVANFERRLVCTLREGLPRERWDACPAARLALCLVAYYDEPEQHVAALLGDMVRADARRVEAYGAELATVPCNLRVVTTVVVALTSGVVAGLA